MAKRSAAIEPAREEKSTVFTVGPRVPPQAVEAEQAVLGALLLDKDAIIKIADVLAAEDFYRPDHRQIYEAILRLYEKRMPLDVITLTDELERTKELAAVGGATVIARLTSGVSTSVNVVHHAGIVHEKGLLRRLISAASAVAELGYQEERAVDELVDEAERLIFEVSEQSVKQKFEPIKAVLTRAFERIEELHEHRGKTRGVPTGFRDLDNLLSGLQESDLVVIAARPSMGKTSLALNIAQHAAIHHQVPIGFFSLEQSKDQLVDRLVAGEAGVDSWKLRTGNLANEDFERLNYAMGVLADAPFFIDDQPNLTVMEVRTKARRLQVEHGLGLLVIDYLQLMQGRQTRDANRVQEISDISRGLKGLARELNVPVIALSQLSRAVETRPNHIPQLSDLRESGSIEQDADVVMFIYREDYYNPETENKNVAKILVRKHRNGPVGEFDLFFQADQTKFRTIDRRHEAKGEA
ncbi:replicative DNA helicase [Candidatus Berkelbacteria bacterium]|nr:replicative DNA helicase [Candidatus Berkelbacteria bacterium]